MSAISMSPLEHDPLFVTLHNPAIERGFSLPEPQGLISLDQCHFFACDTPNSRHACTEVIPRYRLRTGGSGSRCALGKTSIECISEVGVYSTWISIPEKELIFMPGSFPHVLESPLGIARKTVGICVFLFGYFWWYLRGGANGRSCSLCSHWKIINNT